MEIEPASTPPKQDAHGKDSARWSKTSAIRTSTSFFSVRRVALLILGVGGILVSISGPMVTNISGPHEASNTRGAMASLKTALVCFNNDLGKYPFLGESPTRENVNAAADAILGKTASDNILINADAWRKSMPDRPMGLTPQTFAKRWKGPYMDSDPRDFMFDGWKNQIRYLYHEKAIWLHSAGPDETFDPIEKATVKDYQGDDITLSVSKVRF
ncbi:MAG: hypothetical protein WA705_20205 [Candidatus Ozemobacteraceae bacterium]